MNRIAAALANATVAINASLAGTSSTVLPLVATSVVPHLSRDGVRQGVKLVAENPRAYAKTFGKAFAVSFGQGVAWNALWLEVGDWIGARFAERRRQRRIAELTAVLAALPATSVDEQDELFRQLEIVGRKPARRSFGQWLKDLPSRFIRRVTRAAVVEVGWLTWLLTSPAWITAAVLGTAYTWLFVLPATAGAAVFFEKNIDLDFWLAPAVFAKKVVRNTFGLGWRIMAKGFQMRIYNTASLVTDTEGYEVIEAVKPEAYAHVSKIVDQHTAYEWGAHTASLINDRNDVTYEGKLKAYSQFIWWTNETITAEFQKNVILGFRRGTPLMVRDLVRA